MNRLSLRKNRLKFKASREIPIILEESMEHTPIQQRKLKDVNRCNWLDLETLGSWPIVSRKLPGHWSRVKRPSITSTMSWRHWFRSLFYEGFIAKLFVLVCFVKILMSQYGGSLFEIAIHGGEGGCLVGSQRHWCFVCGFSMERGEGCTMSGDVE